MFHAPIPSANMVIGRIEYVEVRGIIVNSQWFVEGYAYNKKALNSCCLLYGAYNLVEETDKETGKFDTPSYSPI